MPFNCLFWHCLEKSKTSCKEKGKSAYIPSRQPDECILVFRTDCPEFKATFRTQRTSDYLFFYKKISQANQCKLVFVELKGTRIREGVDQLRETVKQVRELVLKPCPKLKARCVAVIVGRGGASPEDSSKWQKEFWSLLETTLVIKSEKSVNLRSLL